jgi:hypothetical protein
MFELIEKLTVDKNSKPIESEKQTPEKTSVEIAVDSSTFVTSAVSGAISKVKGEIK